MAFCPYCGKQLADGEVCGCRTNQNTEEQKAQVNETPVAETAAPAEAPAAAPVAPAAPAKAASSKLITYVIIAAVALVALIVGINVLKTVFTAYKKPIKAICTEINKGKNAKKADIVNLATAGLPDDIRAYYKSSAEMFEDSYEDAVYELQEKFNDLNDEYKKWSIDFVYSDVTKLGKDKVADLEEEYSDYWDRTGKNVYEKVSHLKKDDYMVTYYAGDKDSKVNTVLDLYDEKAAIIKDYSIVEIQKGYKIRGYFVFNGDGREYKTDKVTLYVVKINGKWYVNSAKDERFYMSASYSDFLNSYINQGLKNFYTGIAGSDYLTTIW